MSGAHTAWPTTDPAPITPPTAPSATWPDEWLTADDRRALRAEQVQRIQRSQQACQITQAGQTWPLDTPPRIDLQTIKRKQNTITRAVARIATLAVLAIAILIVVRYLIIFYAA
jgi:Flp pilus assembly protein TadB